MNDSSNVGYGTLAEPITMRTGFGVNIEDKVTMSGLYENNRLILLTTWGSSLLIYMCSRVPKRHRAVGLSESSDFRLTYSFNAAALDRGLRASTLRVDFRITQLGSKVSTQNPTPTQYWGPNKTH